MGPWRPGHVMRNSGALFRMGVQFELRKTQITFSGNVEQFPFCVKEWQK